MKIELLLLDEEDLMQVQLCLQNFLKLKDV